MCFFIFIKIFVALSRAVYTLDIFYRSYLLFQMHLFFFSLLQDDPSGLPPNDLSLHKLPLVMGASIFDFISILDCVRHFRTSKDIQKFARRSLRRPRAFGVLPPKENRRSKMTNQALVRKFGALCPKLRRFVVDTTRMASVKFSMIHPADYAFRTGVGVHVATLLQLPCSQHLQYLCLEDDESSVYPLENIEELVPYPQKFLPSLLMLDVVSSRSVIDTAPLWKFMSLWSWVPYQKLILALSPPPDPAAIIDFSLLANLVHLKKLFLIFSHPDFQSPQQVMSELARCLPMNMNSLLVRVIVNVAEVPLWETELDDLRVNLTDVRKMDHLEFRSSSRQPPNSTRFWVDLGGDLKPKKPVEAPEGN